MPSHKSNVNGVVNWDLYEKGGINTDRLIEFRA